MFNQPKKIIAFTLYPGVNPLDLVGPLTVLRDLPPYQTVIVGERIEAMGTDASLRLVPTLNFGDVPNPFAVFVPGGGPATVQAMEDEALLDYVRSAARTAAIVGSTGTGSLVLAAAGLLAGRRAATHWVYGDLLKGMGAVHDRARWVEDGKLITSAGGVAGIDMMLHLVAQLKSESRARLAQLGAEYDPQPPFGAIDWSLADRALAEVIRTPQRI
jgi:transcriptional regulator GlxA family with amidase domain